MKSVNEKSLVSNSQKNYSVHYENDLTKIKIKKVYNIPENKSDEGFIPQILENNQIDDHADSNVESIKTESDTNSENKRRRSGNLNSSNEENSPRVYHEKKRSKIEQRQKMFDEYYPWVLQTYGDAAKTKTITIKKLNRIINALNGKESNRPDSSKFRFWVKTKGFTTTRPENFVNATFEKDNLSKAEATPLYVLQVADSGTQTYKQVAVVEHFFDIIYHIHVALGSKRCGRHAGQKRTYRTITETYAFLPREAVSKFLSLCTQCKKQQINESSTDQKHVTMANASNYYDNRYLTSNLSDTTLPKHERNIGLDYKIKSDWESKEKSNFAFAGNLSTGDINQPNRILFKPYESNNNNKYGDTSKSAPLNISETLNYYQLLTLFYHNFNLTSSVNAPTLYKQDYIKNFSDKLPKITNQLNKDSSVPPSETPIKCNELKVPNFWSVSPKKKEKQFSQLPVTSTPETKNLGSNSKSKEDEDEAIEHMTSTYLSMTRSLGLEDDDALNLVSTINKQRQGRKLQ